MTLSDARAVPKTSTTVLMTDLSIAKGLAPIDVE
jgi:hypothetical protein